MQTIRQFLNHERHEKTRKFSPQNTRKEQKASQTSAMVLKSLFAENKSLVMMYLDGLRLLGGFDALRAGESDIKLNYGILL